MLSRIQSKRQSLLVQCRDKKALRNWFKIYLGFDVFDSIVSRYATSCPLDAAWEIYSFGVNPNSREPRRYLFAAARATQKTITLAAVETALVLHTGRNCLHFAGSKDQVDTAYAYMKQFFSKELIRDLIQGDIKASETIFLVPKFDNRLWLEGKTGEEIMEEAPDSIKITSVKVLPISPFTVQSKHESVVSTDEIHTLKGEKAYAYKDIRKIPVASHDGKPWVRLGISSRKSPDSLVEIEIDDAKNTGLIVKNWTVLEGVERCPDERSGTDFVHERYTNILTGKFLTKDEYTEYDGKDKEKFNKVNFASKCLTCPLRSVCQTDLKKQTSKSKHLQSVDSAITDYTSDNDRQWYLAQCMSMQPSKEGLVFGRFDEDVHHVTADEMYETFTGQKPQYPQTQESLSRLFRMKGLACYVGLDWGFTDPFAVVVIYTDGERVFVIHTFATTGWEVEKDVVPYLYMLEAKFGKFRIFPDTARPDNNSVIKAKFDVHDDFIKKIDTGITKIRAFISPNHGSTKLFVLRGHNDYLVGEIRKYHYILNLDGTPTEDIADEYNHSIDALRYVFLNVFVDGAGILVDIGVSDETERQISMDPYNSFVRQPINPVNLDIGVSSNSGSFKWDFGGSDEE